MISYEVEVKGFDEQIMKLDNFDRIANKHMRQAGSESVALLERKWKEVAPVDTGRYRSSIAGRVSIMGGNVVGIVGTNVRSARGFPYPAALEESQRYRYRAGPRAGQYTMNRVKRLFKRAQDSIKKRFGAARSKVIRELEI
ncbi:MAG: HK97 gp10 family phage protein [Gammaproteobacteria bacterium]|nr:HK97 gp10 family phage protein [Gammaproteobacteria bacterium]